MIVIGTEVLAVDSLGALHRAIVRVGFPRSRGSFLTLKFGEKKPFAGFTQNGELDPVYYQNPLLRARRLFPLLAIQKLRHERTEKIGMNNFSKISVLSGAPLILWPLTSFAKHTDKMQQTIAVSTAATGRTSWVELKTWRT